MQKSEDQRRNPIRAIEKPNKEKRLGFNMIALLDISEKNTYAMSDVKRIFEATLGLNHLTILDLKYAYYQVFLMRRIDTRQHLNLKKMYLNG